MVYKILLEDSLFMCDDNIDPISFILNGLAFTLMFLMVVVPLYMILSTIRMYIEKQHSDAILHQTPCRTPEFYPEYDFPSPGSVATSDYERFDTESDLKSSGESEVDMKSLAQLSNCLANAIKLGADTSPRLWAKRRSLPNMPQVTILQEV